MAITVAELETKFTVDTSQAEKELGGFVDKQAGVVQKGFAGLGSVFTATLVTAVAGAVVNTGVELAKLSVANASVAASFNDLAASAGDSADAMLSAMRDASAGTIADYDLMLSANRAMMLGVADSAEELSRLMEIARRRGQAMGITSAKAFNDIVTGLGRGSALILDNLGIVIDTSAAYGIYAAEIGKAANQLTEVEKKQALVNAAMRDASTQGAAPIVNQFERMDAAVSNMKIAFADMFAPAVVAGAEAVANAVNRMSDPDTPTSIGGLSVNQILQMREDAESTTLRLKELHEELANYDRMLLRSSAEQWEQSQAYVQQILDLGVDFNSVASMIPIDVRPLVEWELAARGVAREIGNLNIQIEATQWGAAGAALEQMAVSMIGYAEQARAAMEIEAAAAAVAWNDSAAETKAAWSDAMGNVGEMVRGMALDLLPTMGPEVFGMVPELTEQYQALYNSLAHFEPWARMGIVAQAIRADTAAMKEAESGFFAYMSQLDEMIRAKAESDAKLSASLDSVAMGAAQSLYNAIGPDAWGYLDEFRERVGAAFDDAVERTGNVEIGMYEANAAAGVLADGMAALHGDGLEEISDAAWRAESQIWGTVAAAESLMQVLGMSQGTVDAMFTGAVGRGLTGAAAAQMAELRNVEREALIADMAALGVGARDAAFALAEFDAETQAAVSGITKAHAESMRETTKTTRATTRAGAAATRVADGLGDLSRSLSSIPGLFGVTSVTDEDMALSAIGRYTPKADEYLRRLRDELQNGVDWEGVDVETAAAAIGWDAASAREHAELFLNEFSAAWADSSLFADAANMDKFLNIDAIQASLERQQSADQGRKNLHALFGIGDADDVNAVAALGLSIQSGLAGWLAENGMEDAGARLAEAMAGGLRTDDMGKAAVEGMEDFASSAGGKAALYDVGHDMGGSMVTGIRDRIMSDLLSRAPAAAGGGVSEGVTPGVSAQGFGLRLPASEGRVTVNQYNTVTQPYDIDMIAHKAASIIARNSRR